MTRTRQESSADARSGRRRRDGSISGYCSAAKLLKFQVRRKTCAAPAGSDARARKPSRCPKRDPNTSTCFRSACPSRRSSRSCTASAAPCCSFSVAVPALAVAAEPAVSPSRFAALQGASSTTAHRSSCCIGLAVGVPASHVRRHPPPRARSALGIELPGARATQLRGARRRARPDARVRGAAMVKREVVGAHYGWRDWLAQRVTAVVMLRLHAVLPRGAGRACRSSTTSTGARCGTSPSCATRRSSSC